MPGVLPGGDGWWAYQQAQQFNLLRGLLTQQQTTISNLDGLPVINFGLIPGSSPARYGLSFVNPSTGSEVMFIGVDDAGVPAVHVYDPLGNEEVRLGELNLSPSIYGLGVRNSAGVLQQVAGVQSQTTTAVQSTASTSFVSLTGDPVVTATIGPSGQAFVIYGARIGTNNANEEGYAGLYVDTTTPSAPFATVSGAAGGTNACSTTTQIVTGLTQGAHTFSLQYKTLLGNSVNFSDRTVSVWAL